MQFYTHVSDQYAPFHTKVINATVRDATHVLDGLLYHESDLRIEEHYTDTAGFTDHVFGLMHLLGFRFAPRIRDLADKRLYIHGDAKQYPTLSGLIGGSVNLKRIRTHWDDILRLAASIRQGTVTASLMLRKLGSYPRQNGLAVALSELGRIEQTLFALDWMQNVDLRRRVQVGLNKGEAKEYTGARRFSEPPRRGSRPPLREPALPCRRPEFGRGGDHPVEYCLSGTGNPGTPRRRNGYRRSAPTASVAAGLGAHQPDRRLQLAAAQAGRTGQIPVAPNAR